MNGSGTEVYTVLDRKTLGNFKKMFIFLKPSQGRLLTETNQPEHQKPKEQ